MVETRQGVSTLVCHVCGNSRIAAPPLSTLLTRVSHAGCVVRLSAGVVTSWSVVTTPKVHVTAIQLCDRGKEASEIL
jgi:hypothetical protein